MEEALQQQPVLSDLRRVANDTDLTTAHVEFASLVERRSRFVFRVAYSVLRNSHDAEDVVQETFLKLYRGDSWRTIRDEAGFLARVAWRIAVERVNKRRDDPPGLEIAATGQDPETAAISADWSAIVHRLIDALPEDLRQPLALSAIEELDSTQIANILGIPEGTVRTRIMRARGILKQKLANRKEGHSAG